MDYLKTPDTTTGPIGSTSTGGVITRQGLLVDGTSPSNASKNWAQYYNMLIEESVYIIEQAGLIPDKNNWHQLHKAIQDITQSSSRKVGRVYYTAAGSPPTGTLIANGAAISRTLYSSLFSAIGTYYGAGDGSNTFNIPDLRGLFIRSLDLGRGVDIGRGLGTYQAQSIESHTHSLYPLRYANAQVIASTGAEISTLGLGAAPTTSATGGPETRPQNFSLIAVIEY